MPEQHVNSRDTTTVAAAPSECNLAEQSIPRDRPKSSTRLPFAAAGLLAIGAYAWFNPTKAIVSGNSMAPTLAPKQTLLLLRHVPIRRFDLVVFEDPQLRGTYDIKRVIGLPGETVFLKDEKLYINGAEMAQPGSMPFTYCKAPVTVPPGRFFVLGDNRGHSVDSRDFGCVLQSECLRVMGTHSPKN